MKIGIIGAMDSEVAALVAALENTTGEPETRGGSRFYSGTLCGREVVVAQCGVGKVCAAICAQQMIDRWGVDAIVNTGVAGGLSPDLAVGDLVVADAAVQHDFDITAFGHACGYMPAMGGDDRIASYYPTDQALAAALRTAINTVRLEKNDSFACHSGVIASGDVFVSSAELKSTLRHNFDAVAAEMEGAAIAQVAYLNGVPFALVRAISDLADGSAAASFDSFEHEAATRSAAILLCMLQNM